MHPVRILLLVTAMSALACSNGTQVVRDQQGTPDIGTVTPWDDSRTGQDGAAPDLASPDTGTDLRADAGADAAVAEITADSLGDAGADAGADLPADTACAPVCEGKSCGDDGCGGNCGTCGEHSQCVEGACECLFLACGEACCGEGAACFEGACCAPSCVGKACGDDGCGGSCGQCPEGDVCHAGACCTPACEGKECGPDGCWGTCGECTGGAVCVNDVCCVPDCDGKQCGEDGCGGSCGICGQTELCSEGQCLADPQYVGCSDGTREGFLNIGAYPLLAACGGAWDVPGIHNETPACQRQAGNSGVNSKGLGCNVTDLCAEGWHVCLGRNDVLYRSPLGCTEIMQGAQSPAFFLVRTSSTGAMNCAPDTIGEPDSVNDLFGCGDLGCPANEASCDPLQLGSHDLCKSLKNKPTSNCACHFYGELDPGDPKYDPGNMEDVVCLPNSGGCGWCDPLDYWNKKLGVYHADAWDCGSSTTKEALNVVKTLPDQQGGVLCCMDQCAQDSDCEAPQVCVMSTCQDP